MSIRNRVIAVAATGSLALAPTALLAPSASADAGERSLYTVLSKDLKKYGTPSFDRRGGDFDILTAAAQGVLAAKPKSPVGVLADGSVKLTAFLPTDSAFKRTGKALGIKAKNEKKRAEKFVNRLGVNGIEKVLLYHVVVGVKINAKTALESDGARLHTALGQSIKINVTKDGIFIKDKARDIKNPKVIVTNINKGNKQIAHGINRVLLPML